MKHAAVPGPTLAIVVVVFNMRREAPRTLHSLSASFQREVSARDYEVIVVENGSSAPLTDRQVAEFGDNFRYLNIADASPSPAAAVNLGAAASEAPFVGIMVDGARIVSPGAVHLALTTLTAFQRPIVGTIGFHLGPDIQTRSPRHGYTREVEDRLLAGIGWRANGYRLFEVSSLAGSTRRGWLGNIAESNLIFLPRNVFEELKGFDERFDLPGGGLVNLDFYRRACESKDSTLITLFGEATFHQIHGGVITNKPVAKVRKEMQVYQKQYQEIHGVRFRPPSRRALLVGYPRPPMFAGLQKTCDLMLMSRTSGGAGQAPTDPPRLSPRQIAELADPPTGHQRRAEDDGGVLAALSFNLLTSLGLRSDHQLLECGCGSLPTRRLLDAYLARDRYWRIEMPVSPDGSAADQDPAEAPPKDRRTRFASDQDFNLDIFQISVDFILAHGVLCHAGTNLLTSALKSAREVLNPGGLLVATFVEHHEDHGPDEWVHPRFNLTQWQTIRAIAAAQGLHCRKIDWPHPLQTWFVASANLDRLQRALEAAAIDALDDRTVLTGWRIEQQRAGRGPGFYLRRDAGPRRPAADD